MKILFNEPRFGGIANKQKTIAACENAIWRLWGISIGKTFIGAIYPLDVVSAPLTDGAVDVSIGQKMAKTMMRMWVIAGILMCIDYGILGFGLVTGAYTFPYFIWGFFLICFVVITGSIIAIHQYNRYTTL